jgi:hypothetical protein
VTLGIILATKARGEAILLLEEAASGTDGDGAGISAGDFEVKTYWQLFQVFSQFHASTPLRSPTVASTACPCKK